MAIFKRGDTYWTKFYVEGKCVRQSLRTKDKKIAEIKEREILHALDRGKLPTKTKKILIDDAFQEFIEYKKPLRTKESQRTDINRLGLVFQRMQCFILSELTPAKIEKYKHKRIESVRPQTVNHDIVSLSGFFEWCVKMGYSKSNPCKNIARVKVQKNIPKYLSQEQVSLLLSHAKDFGLYEMLFTSVYTGMRPGEIIRLEWEDINFTEKTIYVRNKEHKDTKTKKERAIPMSEGLFNMLTQYKIKAKNSQFCFVRSDNQPWKQSPRRRFNELRKACGLPKWVDMYTLRHTFASHLVMNKVDIMTISEFLGHADISTTMRYLHVSNEYKQDKVNLLDF